MLVVCGIILRPSTTRKNTGFRHHLEDQGGITGREKKYWNTRMGWMLFLSLIHLWEDFLNHSCGHQMVLQRQVWSMRCWSRHEHEGMRKWRVSHIKTVIICLRCAGKWLMTTVNVAQEKRGYDKCCAGERCSVHYKLGVQGNNFLYSLMGKIATLQTALAAFISWSPEIINLAVDE